jgi:excisionase family DNA binding protein
MTVAEVAEILRLNQQTVRNWIDRGELPAVHVGRRVRIKRTDFDRLLDRGYTRVPAPPATETGLTAQDFWDGTVRAPVE